MEHLSQYIEADYAVLSAVLYCLGRVLKALGRFPNRLIPLTLTGCGSKGADDKTIKVAATAVPHAEILEAAKPLLEEQGYTLEVQVFDDYVQPNEVVESGEFDANYFQHIPYLESFNEEKGTHLVNAGGIHYEPFGLYPGTETSLDLSLIHI